jgi:hypothetical protein
MKLTCVDEEISMNKTLAKVKLGYVKKVYQFELNEKHHYVSLHLLPRN